MDHGLPELKVTKQFVRLKTVAPQGTALSLSLFSLYSFDYQYKTSSCHLQKFLDDSLNCRVCSQWRWIRGGGLCLELVRPATIQGENVKMVQFYTYLNFTLDWSDSTNVWYRKGQSGFFFLWRHFQCMQQTTRVTNTIGIWRPAFSMVWYSRGAALLLEMASISVSWPRKPVSSHDLLWTHLKHKGWQQNWRGS